MSSEVTPIHILDGGLGTTLEDQYGIRFSSAATPLWSSHLLLAEHDRATLRDCQSSFVRAGADVLLTATYQASVEGFARTRNKEWPDGVSESDVPQFVEAALLIAEEAAAAAAQPSYDVGSTQQPGKAKIALSLGPYGACMIPSQEYSGRYDAGHDGEEELFAWHRDRLWLCEKVRSLGDRVDYIAFETVPRRDEILAVRRALASCSPATKSKRFWISCVFPGQDENGLPDGSEVGDVVSAMLDPDVSEAVPWGVGINCTKIGKLPSLVTAYEKAIAELTHGSRLKRPPALVLYPDGTNGEVYDTVSQEWRSPEPGRTSEVSWERQLADVVRDARQRGVWSGVLAGGCCKTTPDDIRRLAAEVGQGGRG